MAKDFLEAGDRDSFLGMELKELPSWGRGYFKDPVRCNKCKGYGGWHLSVDAYGKGKHFDCTCGQCMGWGWVSRSEADHLHEFVGMEEGKANAFRASKGLPPARFTYGNCCHNVVCKVCGEYRFYDSSD